MPDIAALVTLLRLVTKDRTQLPLENIALRQQLAVYKRSVGRPYQCWSSFEPNRYSLSDTVSLMAVTCFPAK